MLCEQTLIASPRISCLGEGESISCIVGRHGSRSRFEQSRRSQCFDVELNWMLNSLNKALWEIWTCSTSFALHMPLWRTLFAEDSSLIRSIREVRSFISSSVLELHDEWIVLIICSGADRCFQHMLIVKTPLLVAARAVWSTDWVRDVARSLYFGCSDPWSYVRFELVQVKE